MELKFQLNDKEKAFLKEFYEKQHDGAKDNLGTRDAIHVVEREEKIFVPCSDADVWYSSELNEYFHSFDEMIGEIKKDKVLLPDFNEVYLEWVNEVFIESEADYLKAYELEAYGGKVVLKYRPVAFFFILDEAKRYKNDYQAHNCSDCRIYTYGLGYSNYGDLPVFRNMLLNMGKKLLECEDGAKNENKEDS